MVEVSLANQSNILSKCSVIGTFAISVEKHRALNSCRGVMYEPDLHPNNEEILEHLQSQNVTEIRRITLRRNGQILPTKHLILTFKIPKKLSCLPELFSSSIHSNSFAVFSMSTLWTLKNLLPGLCYLRSLCRSRP